MLDEYSQEVLFMNKNNLLKKPIREVLFITGLSFSALAFIYFFVREVLAIGSLKHLQLTEVSIAAFLVLFAINYAVASSRGFKDKEWLFRRTGIQKYEPVCIILSILSLAISLIEGYQLMIISLAAMIASYSLLNSEYIDKRNFEFRRSVDPNESHVSKEDLVSKDNKEYGASIETKSFSWASKLDYLPGGMDEVRDTMIEIQISKDSYAIHRDDTRYSNDLERRVQYAVGANGNTTDILNAARTLIQIAENRGWAHYRRIHMVLSFIRQCIEQENQNEREPQMPLTTLYEEKGRNIDKCILAASILKNMGLAVCIILYGDVYYVGIESSTHIREFSGRRLVGGKYYLGSVNNDELKLGEIPVGMRNEDLKIVEA